MGFELKKYVFKVIILIYYIKYTQIYYTDTI